MGSVGADTASLTYTDYSLNSLTHLVPAQLTLPAPVPPSLLFTASRFIPLFSPTKSKTLGRIMDELRSPYTQG